jgi:rod shape determining protein RodA
MKSTNLAILAVAILISTLGIMSIYSSTYEKESLTWQMTYQRQIFWAILGLALFMLMSNFPYHRLRDISYFLYAAALFLLFLVFLLGAVRLGAQRWLKFAWFNFQPSEVAKIVIVIFLARYFSRKSVDNISLLVNKTGMLDGVVLPFIFIAIPMGLIIEQPDLGSGTMILAVFAVMLYLTGVRLRQIILFLALIILLTPVAWHFLRDYQRDRLMVFLNPNIDPLGAGYTVIQSRIAIGSGGFLGKGWLSGTQSQLRFLPESHTDFIFATFAEEWGFLGCLLLLSAYYFLIVQGLRIGFKTKDNFGRLLAFGISAMLGIQVFINIAMNLGFAPVVGLPLPLMSYGGSSILMTFIALGILANINKTGGVF